jgi:GT2 family glycosyltransferase
MDDIQQKLKKKRRKELFAYFREIAARDGFMAAVRRTLAYMKRRHGGKRGRFLPTHAEMQNQRATDITGWPKISVCVPVYNPSRQFFDELLQSVVGQTYPNWELCIANGSEEPGVYREVANQYADERIRYTEVENEGISANTNRAAAMSTGQYLAFLDHDDILSPDALFQIAQRIAGTEASFLYSDEALFENDYTRPTVGHFKPDYSPQYLLNVNYIAHLAAVRRELFFKVGQFSAVCDGSQDLDLYLRILEETGSASHIRRVLYYWRQHEQSTSTGVEAKPYVAEAAKRAIDAHLLRTEVRGKAVDGKFPSTYKVDYAVRGMPLVSIIIPSSDHVPDLDRCIRSVYGVTQYRQFEVLVVENNSKDVQTFAYYQKLTKTYPECRVLVYEEEEDKYFNFSRICNFGLRHAKGEYLLFLNKDTEALNHGWLAEMLQLAQLEDVGAVGALLYYPDSQAAPASGQRRDVQHPDTVQHAGIIVGLGGYAGHSHKYAERGKSGYMFRQACVQELSAVTGACIMLPRKAFDAVGGFDTGFAVAYNDVDLCLQLRRRGYSVLFTPYAELYHYESKSRGTDEDGAAAARFSGEQEKLLARYGEELMHDPYYSPWLTYDREDFSENDVLPQTQG